MISCSRRSLLRQAILSLLLLWRSATLTTVNAAAAAEVVEGTQRAGNIDLLDTETMLYYMDPECREDFDVVVLFYAQWCTNCRALSPIYIQIADILKAGSTTSSLIMGYFDCEADMDHAAVCSQAGITHYPTLQFYSLSGQHLPSAVRADLPKHATQFAGNWQLGEAIMDWIKAMSFLSRWHRAGWGEKLRGWLFSKKKTSGTALPVGIPPMAAAERRAETLQAESTSMRDVALRSSTFLDALLIPANNKLQPTMTDGHHGGRYTDVFAYLSQSNRWYAQNDVAVTVLRTCAMEVALDICQRHTSHATEEWIASQPIPEIDYITEEQLSHFSEDLAAAVMAREPFCSVVEDCIRQDYQPDACRPEKCPFEDPVGCRYVAACLSESVQNDYADALGVTLPETGGYSYEPLAATPDSAKEPEREKASNWGLS